MSWNEHYDKKSERPALDSSCSFVYKTEILTTNQGHEITQLFPWPANQGEQLDTGLGISFDVLFGEHKLETEDYIAVCTLVNATLRISYEKCSVSYCFPSSDPDSWITKQTVYNEDGTRKKQSVVKAAGGFLADTKLDFGDSASTSSGMHIGSNAEGQTTDSQSRQKVSKLCVTEPIVRPIACLRWKFGFGEQSRKMRISLGEFYTGLGKFVDPQGDVRHIYSFEPVDIGSSVTATLVANARDLDISWVERSIKGKIKSVLSPNKEAIAKMLFLRKIGGRLSKDFEVSKSQVRVSKVENS